MHMIRKARLDDMNRIEQLVGQAGLKTTGIEQNVDNFLIMETEAVKNGDATEQALIAVVGFELQNQNGLLRSFVINEKSDQFNILELMKAVIEFAKNNRLKRLYLCTKQQSSVKLFHLLGFKLAEESPEELTTFTHFQNIKAEQPKIMYYSF